MIEKEKAKQVDFNNGLVNSFIVVLNKGANVLDSILNQKKIFLFNI